MPSIISCPSCQKQLKVPDELIGKSVKCPGCKETFTAQTMSKSSASAPPARQEREEVVEKPRKKAAPPPDDEEDEEEAPRKPVKRRAADDDDEDERPSQRGKRSGGPMAPHRGILILILGVGSLVGNVVVGGLALLLGPVAWLLANHDLKEMDAGRMDPEGRSNTQIGKICGIIATVLLILSVVLTCVGVILFFALFGVAASNVPKH